MAPLLLIATAVAGLFFGRQAAQAQVSSQIDGLLGHTGAKAVEAALANAGTPATGVVATVIGVVTLLVGSTTVFVELQSALNVIWDAPPPKITGIIPALRARGLSFAMVLVIGFLLLVSLALSAVISGLGAHVGELATVSPLGMQVINTAASVLVGTGLFAMLFRFVPDVRIPWADVWVGALVTSVLFAVGKQLIGLYLGNSSIASAYGAAGSLAVMLVWVYYSAQILLFGAQFTQVYSRQFGSKAGGS